MIYLEDFQVIRMFIIFDCLECENIKCHFRVDESLLKKIKIPKQRLTVVPRKDIRLAFFSEESEV